MRQKFVEFSDRMYGDAVEHIVEPGEGSDLCGFAGVTKARALRSREYTGSMTNPGEAIRPIEAKIS